MTTTDSTTTETSGKNAAKSALLVIDVQQGSIGEGWQRDEVIDRIRTLIDQAKAAGAPVIWIQHEAGPFKPGSDTWQIMEKVRPDEGETVIGKHVPGLLRRHDRCVRSSTSSASATW